MTECEVWVLVDADGNYVASDDAGHLGERYDDTIGNSADMARRVVRITVRIPTPAPLQVSVDVPAEQGSVSVKVG